MPELVPPLPYLLMRGQQAVHRPFGAEVLPFVEQGRVDFSRSEVHEPRLVEHCEHCGLFFG
jgi:hypothetical protein